MYLFHYAFISLFYASVSVYLDCWLFRWINADNDYIAAEREHSEHEILFTSVFFPQHNTTTKTHTHT